MDRKGSVWRYAAFSTRIVTQRVAMTDGARNEWKVGNGSQPAADHRLELVVGRSELGICGVSRIAIMGVAYALTDRSRPGAP